jgi:dihydropteroate synthase
MKTLIFPARDEMIPQHCDHRLVEVLHSGDLDVKEARKVYSSVIDGKNWNHYIVDLLDLSESSISKLEASFPLFQELRKRMNDMDQNFLTRPKLMAIANATPDSFYPGSRVSTAGDLEDIINSKPDIIDIGGESTRPGSDEVPYEVEIERVKPIVEYLSSTTKIPLSLDSRHPQTVKKFAEQIEYINDISGFSSEDMIATAKDFQLNCIVMHMRGTPADMQSSTHYDDIVAEIVDFLSNRVINLMQYGIPINRIIVDPGIGFAKDLWGNLSILRNVKSFRFGPKLLVGTSRKGFIGKITGEEVSGRLPGTIATSVYLALKGVDILRVHDLRENRESIDVLSAIFNLEGDRSHVLK